MRIDPISVWWEVMPGPQRLIHEMTQALSSGQSVVLSNSQCLVWRTELTNFVGQRITTAAFERIAWTQTEKNRLIPQLMQMRDISPQYLDECPSQYKMQLRFIQKEKVFRNKVTWVERISEESAVSLIQAISDMRGSCLSANGAFVVELEGELEGRMYSSSIRIMDARTYTAAGDIQLYATMLVANTPQIPAYMQNYVACLLSNLSASDAELISAMVSAGNYACEEPMQLLHSILDNSLLEESHEGDQEHPFSLLRSNHDAKLIRRIWKSQLQSLFDVIEYERVEIADKHRSEIEEAIKEEYWDESTQSGKIIEQKGGNLQTAEDVELGTLTFMMSVRKNIDRSQYLLYFADGAMRDRILFLRDLRNKLAHRQLLTPIEINKLLTSSVIAD